MPRVGLLPLKHHAQAFAVGKADSRALPRASRRKNGDLEGRRNLLIMLNNLVGSSGFEPPTPAV